MNHYSRITIITDFTGDPNSFEPALPLDSNKKIKRLKPSEAKLHTIQFHLLDMGNRKILGQMKGTPVPQSWQGGLKFHKLMVENY